MATQLAIQLRDRTEAGQLLATKLKAYADRTDVIVLALLPGGVPVGVEVAKALHVPLDICLVRKLSVPGHKELTLGAIASDGVRVLNYDVVSWLGISSKTIDEVAARELRELQRRDRAYRGHRSPPDLRNRTVILIDDGLETAAMMRAAVAVLQQDHPARIVVAVPVAAPEACKALKTEVEQIVCGMMPEPFYALGLWYENFAQITDKEIHEWLALPTVKCEFAVGVQ